MLEIRNIRKTFHPGTPNQVRALQGVEIQLDPGSFTIIIGTNGSGKSTLLNAVAGSFFVDHGQLRIDGADVTRWPEHQRARLIGRVFQNPFSGTAPNCRLRRIWRSRRAAGCRAAWALRSGPICAAEMRDVVRQLDWRSKTARQCDRHPLGGQRQALTLLMATWRKPSFCCSTSTPRRSIPRAPTR